MLYVVISFGRLGILGHDAVTGTLSDLLPMQHYAEWAKVGVLQFDVRCDDTELLLLEVQVHLLKLFFQCSQIRGDIPRTENLQGSGSSRKFSAKPVEPPPEAGRREVEVREEAVRRDLPSLIPGQLKPADRICKLVPLAVV